MTSTSEDPDIRGPHRYMRCVDCGRRETAPAFPYRWRWYRCARGRMKLRCKACGAVWLTPYP